jgi:hypothetical protein
MFCGKEGFFLQAHRQIIGKLEGWANSPSLLKIAFGRQVKTMTIAQGQVFSFITLVIHGLAATTSASCWVSVQHTS